MTPLKHWKLTDLATGAISLILVVHVLYLILTSGTSFAPQIGTTSGFSLLVIEIILVVAGLLATAGGEVEARTMYQAATYGAQDQERAVESAYQRGEKAGHTKCEEHHRLAQIELNAAQRRAAYEEEVAAKRRADAIAQAEENQPTYAVERVHTSPVHDRSSVMTTINTLRSDPVYAHVPLNARPRDL